MSTQIILLKVCKSADIRLFQDSIDAIFGRLKLLVHQQLSTVDFNEKN